MTSPFSFMNNSDLTFRKEQTVANLRERVILGPTYCIVVLGVFCPNNTNDDANFMAAKAGFHPTTTTKGRVHPRHMPGASDHLIAPANEQP